MRGVQSQPIVGSMPSLSAEMGNRGDAHGDHCVDAWLRHLTDM